MRAFIGNVNELLEETLGTVGALGSRKDNAVEIKHFIIMDLFPAHLYKPKGELSLLDEGALNQQN